MQNEVKVNVNLQVDLRPDAGVWVAYCPSLDLATQADTEPEALAAIKEAVELWFESCLDRGVLAEALEESGFRRTPSDRPASSPSPNSRQRRIEIELPAYASTEIDFPVHTPN